MILIATGSHPANNYRRALQEVGLSGIVSMDLSLEKSCDGLILPGGGDICPSLFYRTASACKKSDFEEDLRQMELFYQFY